ncbi:Cystathionine gamma-lyase [Reticulomyxa filosa]|uniref:cystathionine gamma-lyase n=1 Tax=Reticulomyxa filosa TaxID=46433 RepID=X6PEB5_RETFI|nr:Cystathionine gamma-lyase [Reticulomyxa filosa]|eukprot:ETO36845.1 Cystathionine gamma-lyase [Reticulomyxa filosa]
MKNTNIVGIRAYAQVLSLWCKYIVFLFKDNLIFVEDSLICLCITQIFEMSYKGFGTKTIHSGQEPNPLHGAVMPSIDLSTTFAQASPGKHKGFDYTRAGNPTRDTLEALFAAVENGKYCTCFSSGCGATTTVITSFVKSGEHIVSSDDVYGGTNRLLRKFAEDVCGMKVTLMDLTETNELYKELEQIFKKNKTKLLWLESPTNPMLKVVNISKLCEIARKYNVLTALDNTFATPYLQNPLDLGVDMVVHSVTKYLNGHSDVLSGCVITNSKSIDERLRFFQKSLGAVPSPFDCYMIIRGMKTLHVRMQRHCENALAVAEYLEKHPKVQKVIYPFLKSHPQYALSKKQMRAGGGMVTFFLKGGLPESRQFLENVKLMVCAESLGAVETLVEHPAIMTHASVPPAERQKLGIHDNLIRVSVGIENIEDIIADFDRALGAVGKQNAKL